MGYVIPAPRSDPNASSSLTPHQAWHDSKYATAPNMSYTYNEVLQAMSVKHEEASLKDVAEYSVRQMAAQLQQLAVQNTRVTRTVRAKNLRLARIDEVASKVLKTYKLPENIVSHLHLKDVVTARRVDNPFKTLIDRSSKLQKYSFVSRPQCTSCRRASSH